MAIPLPSRVRAIGYWIDSDNNELPHPAAFIDPTWDLNERTAVAKYLNVGRQVMTSSGRSPCRICRAANGFDDFTDGVFQWPEGLAHYVLDHAVRLPGDVIQHVLRSDGSLVVGLVDKAWWIAATQ